ncbi:hypothetical protein ACFOX0_12290 [Micromonospora zhanjiangensis]|uniref:Uncharacterized protein n=1 Tax=Micromonospora zhanjiangensis TaxID=1522057 RepID=A0ABV8KKR1_9ACTN
MSQAQPGDAGPPSSSDQAERPASGPIAPTAPDPSAGERWRSILLVVVTAVVGLVLVGGLAAIMLPPGSGGPVGAGWVAPGTPASWLEPVTDAGSPSGTPSRSPSLAATGATPTPPTTRTPARRSTPSNRPSVKPAPKPTGRGTTPPARPTTPAVQQGVTPFAPCSPVGAKGMTTRGWPMTCHATRRDPTPRWYPG